LYPIPDVSSAISILFHSKKYLRVYKSLFLIGTSKSSTGLKIESLLDVGKKEISTQFDTTSEKGFVPGRGLTTNLHWYIVEAADIILNKKVKYIGQSLYTKSHYRIALILAQDLSKIRDRKFRKLYFEVNLKSKLSDYFMISLLTVLLSLVYKSKSVFKYFYLVNLIVLKRIKLSYKISDKEIIACLSAWDEAKVKWNTR
jgi:hypothetical protein